VAESIRRETPSIARELVEALRPAGQAGEHGEAPLRAEDTERTLEGVEARIVRDPGTCRYRSRRHDVVQYGTSRENGTEP
jgi:hypothetical protein